MLNFIPNSLYDLLGDTQTKDKLRQTITNIVPSINQKDIDNRVKLRYFARYASQRTGDIYELDGGQYNIIENNSLFLKTTIDWIIKGRLEDNLLTLADNTPILIKGVISQNKALLGLAEEKLPGITNHLRNYMEFWMGE